MSTLMLGYVCLVMLVTCAANGAYEKCPDGFEDYSPNEMFRKCCKACIEGQVLIKECGDDMGANICETTTTETLKNYITSVETSTKAPLILSIITRNSDTFFQSTADNTVSTTSQKDQVKSTETSHKASIILTTLSGNYHTSFPPTAESSPHTSSPFSTAVTASPAIINTGNADRHDQDGGATSIKVVFGFVVLLVCVCLIVRDETSHD